MEAVCVCHRRQQSGLMLDSAGHSRMLKNPNIQNAGIYSHFHISEEFLPNFRILIIPIPLPFCISPPLDTFVLFG